MRGPQRSASHQWVEANPVDGSTCRVCQETLSPPTDSHPESMASIYNCLMCGLTVHAKCGELAKLCVPDPHREFKLPSAALHKRSSASGETRWTIDRSRLPEGCVPYLIFINKKAGGQQGKKVYQAMRALFNPLQVFDLNRGGLMAGLRMFFPLARRGPGFRIMVCGGDGTVNWVCQGLSRIKFPRPEYIPSIALLPLGTGNDLSGFLGWGVGYTGGELNEIFSQLHKVETMKLDRWKATIVNFSEPDDRQASDAGMRLIPNALPPKNVKHLSSPAEPCSTQQTTMVSELISSLLPSSDWQDSNDRSELPQGDSEEQQRSEGLGEPGGSDLVPVKMNDKEDDDDGIELEEEEDLMLGAEVKSFHHSFSIGVDAKITWNFHLAREANPENFTSRAMNKFKYFTQGVSSIIEGGCRELAQAIEFVEIDGRIIWSEDLPQGIESLIFGNIPAYADGTDLWAKPTGNFKPQKVDDKVLEVIGHKGSIHLVQIKAGVSRAFQLGQGRHMKLQTRDVLPMQLDGEPWLQGPALIQIEHFNQVSMIVPKGRARKDDET
jgi:hypothetical protein